MMYSKVCECGKRFVSRSSQKKYCSTECEKIARKRRKDERDQLCWLCKNAYGGCNWSRCFKPVEGWTAKPIIVKDSTGDISSFRIKKCPEFKG